MSVALPGPASGPVAPVALFLAVVFGLSAWRKSRVDWPAQLEAYGLWAETLARRLATLVTASEIVAAIALLTLGFGGIVAAGALFLSYGIARVVASQAGYDGVCGCSAYGKVDRLKIVRAFAWAIVLLAVGLTQITASLPVATVLTAAMGGFELAVILLLIAAAPGPRVQRVARRPQD